MLLTIVILFVVFTASTGSFYHYIIKKRLHIIAAFIIYLSM